MSDEYWLQEQLDGLGASIDARERMTSKDGKGPSWEQVTVYLSNNRLWPNDDSAAIRSPQGQYLLLCKNHRRLGSVYADLDEDVRRERFPDNFEEWTEAEHPGKQRLFTWEQQQNVWAHKRAGEALANHQLTRGEYDRLIADYEPLPIMTDVLAMFATVRARRWVHKITPMPGTKAPPAEERPQPVSAAQLAEVQAKVDRLQADNPDATAGQILRMLEGKR